MGTHMSNDYLVVTHVDERRGTDFAGLDEDRAILHVRSNSYDGRHLERRYRDREPWLLPLLVVDNTDGNRVVAILRRYKEGDPFASHYEQAVIDRWQEQTVRYTSTSRAMSHAWGEKLVRLDV